MTPKGRSATVADRTGDDIRGDQPYSADLVIPHRRAADEPARMATKRRVGIGAESVFSVMLGFALELAARVEPEQEQRHIGFH